MVNVNKKYLDAKLKKRAWSLLLSELKKAGSDSDVEKVLSAWLTPKEMVMLEKRLAIWVLADAGVRHNEIKRILDVSSHTITSLKRKLERCS